MGRGIIDRYNSLVSLGESGEKKFAPENLQSMIDKVRAKVKKHPTVIEMFEKYEISLDEIDLFPMAFADIDVSARTEKGIIYFNYKLLEDGSFDKDDHYMVHELTHVLQQTTGTRPTKGSNSGNYLNNKEEVEGFQNQVEYMADTKGEDKAEKYVEQVLDHHDVNNGAREKKFEELTEKIANRMALLNSLA